MKIYHYTKGRHLKSIFKDGFIATEQKRNTNYFAPFCTDVVWLTESKSVPVTALPYIPSIPSTDLGIRKHFKNMRTDYASIEPVIGGFWRFGFDSRNHKFEKWIFSKARNEAKNRKLVESLDRIANKVGDNIRLFWVSEKDIPLENYTFEYFSIANNVWTRCDPHTLAFRENSSGDGCSIIVYPYYEAA
jgi:hypothetical protein